MRRTVAAHICGLVADIVEDDWIQKRGDLSLMGIARHYKL